MYWKRALTVHRPQAVALNKRDLKISSKGREFLQRQWALCSVGSTEKLGAGRDAKSRFGTSCGGKMWRWGGILEEGLGSENAKDIHACTRLRAKLTPNPKAGPFQWEWDWNGFDKGVSSRQGCYTTPESEKKKKKSQERRHIIISTLAIFQLN